MKMRKNTSLLMAASLVLIAATGSALAQSTHRDHPTPFTSDEIKGELNAKEIEYFYSFTAGPGEVTLTVDVKSTDGTTGTAFELLDSDANKALVCCEFAQADSTGTTGRAVKSIKLSKGQTVILHLTPFKYGTGSYRVRISGAVNVDGHGRQ
jgi:ABC-type glycerol-3-phosphate transport system substrate-binding protein